MSDRSQAITHSRKRHKQLLKRADKARLDGDLDAADKLYREYLTHTPDDPTALFNVAAIAQQRMNKAKDNRAMQFQFGIEAVEHYAKVIDAPAASIENKADAFNNHGLVMQALGHPDKAKIAFHVALQLNPGHRAARLNLAGVMVLDMEYDEADKQFHEVIAMDEGSAGAMFSRGMILLLNGELKRGFRDYRARFNVRECVSKILQTDKPMWDGAPLDGKTLIITLEQGFGDQMQFIRYAREIKKQWPTSRVFFSCPDFTHRLFRGAIGLDGCLPDHLTPEFKDACPPFDYHAPLLHLPDIMGTTLENIPAECPYILPQPDWIELPLEPTDKKRIGIVWAGSPTHGKDGFRSMKPEQFQRFIDAAPNCAWYSLQCGPRAHETEQLTNCVNLPQFIYDWTQTANALLQMSLVVTVDTAVAHLAGALNVPTWILLPSSPDWRWRLGVEHTEWYPRTRLFRQEQRGDWDPVIGRVCNEVSKL